MNRYLVIGLLLLAGCAGLITSQLFDLYGGSNAKQRLVSADQLSVDYWTEVKPILDNRCVSCHACYDAPCQLKLTAPEAIDRGITHQRVYDARRLKQAQTTRLFEDANNTQGWRDLGFSPVLNERVETAQANREASVLYQSLELKKRNPLAKDQPFIPDEVELANSDSWQCPTDDVYSQFAESNPQHGMPYGFPALSSAEASTLQTWVEAGARYSARPALSEELVDRVALWEEFLNKESLQAQLASRYIYEHLFLANLFFNDPTVAATQVEQYFRIVRSRTKPGQPVDLIATRRPYDDPGVERVYYRLEPYQETVVAKTHMPYALNSTRLSKWQKWFLESDYSVTSLPSYKPEDASNPIKTFVDLPAESRYRFMLEESNFTIKGFIKGPVCKGQSAVNVINEHFWVFFVDPKHQSGERMERFLSDNLEAYQLPASQEDTLALFSSWNHYAEKEQKLIKARSRYLSDAFENSDDFGIDMIWDGDGGNPNSTLTVFRHFDAASVNQGLIGQTPKTAWVIDYPQLERIHYLLVAGYDVYGNIGHQLLSRIYMDFLRMEGESLFLHLLPHDARKAEREFWYRKAPEEVNKYMKLERMGLKVVSSVEYKTERPKQELFALLRQHLEGSLPQKHRMDASLTPSVAKSLSKLQTSLKKGFQYMPDVAMLQINSSKDKPSYVTLVKNVGHLNVASILFENLNIEHDETGLSAVPGFIGSYPNVFFSVEESGLDALVAAITSIKTKNDYVDIVNRYGIRRTNPDFWRRIDQFTAGFRERSPVEFGVLDLNKYENK
ncbi:MAG: hypothetical protein ACJAYF_003097 [Arenicella sp.]|jgi:hypothetical protein